MRRVQGKGEKGHPGQENWQEQELDVHVANSRRGSWREVSNRTGGLGTCKSSEGLSHHPKFLVVC